MKRPALVLATLLLAVVALAGTGGPVGASAGAGVADTPVVTRPAGLPDDVPPAALRAEPARATPDGWAFGSAFPRTSGTGRLDDGAAFWSDYLYDDHGAKGDGTPATGSTGVALLAPTTGSYSYASPTALGNGADIFGSAVGVDAGASYWRVDWTTLADPAVPLAVWAIDSDDDAATGSSAVGSGTGVSTPGLDHTITVGSAGALVTDLATGASTRLATTVSDGSFVVRVPISVLPLTGTARVRLVSAVADETGLSAAAVGPANGATPGQPAVYDVSYDAMATEPASVPIKGVGDVPVVSANNWSEAQQATSLAAGDITSFSTEISWDALRSRQITPESMPTGISTRWYLAGRLGTGGVVKPGNTSIAPAFLSSPQPYDVDIPAGLPAHPPLTLLLHSSNSAHTQYATTAPKTLTELCDDRKSICVTPLARGPNTWYFDASEVDFWQVWRQVALAYDTDPDRTVIGGYSMGGWATYRLGLTYPDLFAGALSLEGRVNCGVGLDGGTNGVQQGGRCSSGDGDTQGFVANARTIPWVVSHSTTDELVPYPTVLSQVQVYQNDGLRMHFETYTGQDHVTFALADAFTTEVAALGGTPTRSADIGTLDLHWWSDLTDAAQGLGPQGNQWVRGLAPRTSAAGLAAGFSAVDHALPLPSVTASTATSANASAVPSPSVVMSTTWAPEAPATTSNVLDVTLRDLSLFGIDAQRAHLPTGTANITTDGATTYRLTNLDAATVVTGPAGVVPVVDGVADVPLLKSGSVTWTVASSGAAGAAAAAENATSSVGSVPAMRSDGLSREVRPRRTGTSMTPTLASTGQSPLLALAATAFMAAAAASLRTRRIRPTGWGRVSAAAVRARSERTRRTLPDRGHR